MAAHVDQTLSAWYDQGYADIVRQAQEMRASGHTSTDVALEIASELHRVSACILADILTAVVMRAVSEAENGEMPRVD